MHRLPIFLLVVFVVSGAALAQQNVLGNPGFEVNPPPSFGNNSAYPIAPWVVVSGTPNVVKVDGPGGFNYGSSGPESDASAPGAGVPQHYLDINAGSGTFYQTFTPRCSGVVRFGGSFSTRANLRGTGYVELRQGSSPSGTLVGVTQPIELLVGNSQFDPWQTSTFSAVINAFQTYTLVVHMDDNLNFDNGFVIYNDACNAEAADPCCPPWNTAALQSMMVYQSGGGIAAPYTLKFQPTALFNSQMQAYINYLNAVNPAITQITIEFRLHDGGTGSAPVMLSQMGVSHYITWQAGGSGGFPAPNFFSGLAETMVVNHWYVVHTGIYLENGQVFFPSSCGDNDIGVRVQVQALGAPGPVLILRDASGRTTATPLWAPR